MPELDDITGAIVDASVRVASVHGKQLLTYLKLTNVPVGPLINCAATLREGFASHRQRPSRFRVSA